MKTGASKLTDRMDRLEKRMSDIYEVVISLKVSVDKFLSNKEQRRLGSALPESMITRGRLSEISMTPDRLPNPWAIETAKNLMDSRLFRQMIKKSYETYRPTIETLESKSNWLSTSDVSKMTGRKRNTESTYLNRLFNANLVEREKRGRKVLYKLKDKKKLSKVFGIKC